METVMSADDMVGCESKSTNKVSDLIIRERQKHKELEDRQILADIVLEDDEDLWFVNSNDIYIWYYAIGKVLSPSSILEIGTRAGYSLKAMISGSSVPPSEISLWSLDGELDIVESQDYCEYYFGNLGCRCDFRKGLTQDIDDLNITERVDIVHIDAFHSEEGCYHECALGIRVLKDGGYLLIDDISSGPLVKAGAIAFCRDYNLSYEYLPSFNGMFLIKNDIENWIDGPKHLQLPVK